jgi:hypothetical protein
VVLLQDAMPAMSTTVLRIIFPVIRTRFQVPGQGCDSRGEGTGGAGTFKVQIDRQSSIREAERKEAGIISRSRPKFRFG